MVPYYIGGIATCRVKLKKKKVIITCQTFFVVDFHRGDAGEQFLQFKVGFYQHGCQSVRYVNSFKAIYEFINSLVPLKCHRN